MALIQRDKSIIPACDVSLEKYEQIVKETAGIDGVGGYKIGHVSGRKGWETWVRVAREHTEKPLIYDAQKMGNDIPDTAASILTELKESGFDAVILFPFTGPLVEHEWITTAQSLELNVILGSRMTHSRQMEGDYSNPKDKDYSEIFRELGFENDLAGFIRKSAPDEMYQLAARLGVTDYVAPGNKPDDIERIRSLLMAENVDPVLYAPGFVDQGGLISDAAKVAGDRWHAIIGRGIYKASNIRAAAEELTSQL